MTVPSERYNSIVHVRMLLRDLIDPKKTPKVPSEVRRRAGLCLRHFPSSFEMGEVAAALPEQWAGSATLEDNLSPLATCFNDVSQKSKNSDTSL